MRASINVTASPLIDCTVVTPIRFMIGHSACDFGDMTFQRTECRGANTDADGQADAELVVTKKGSLTSALKGVSLI